MTQLQRSRKIVIHNRNIRWELDGNTLQEAVDTLTWYKEQYGEEARLDFDNVCDSTELGIAGERLETDEELASRQAYQDKQDNRKAESDMEAYLRIKAQMEGEGK